MNRLARKGLILAVSLIFTSIGQFSAANTLLSENFDGGTPGSAYGGVLPGTAFRAASGNLDIIGSIPNGAASGYRICPANGVTPNNCLDLNGLAPGVARPNAAFTLTAGVTYTLAFSAAGSIAGAPAMPYTFTVSLGNSGPTSYTVPGGSSFVAERFTYTPTANEIGAVLSLASTTALSGAIEYGPLIDTLTLSDSLGRPTRFVPLQESFDRVAPGANFSGPLGGSAFSVASGNVDVLGNLLNGAASGFFTCPPGLSSGGLQDLNNCVDLNGDQPGGIETTSPFHLTAGATYRVSFALAGGFGGGAGCAYTVNAALGDSGDIGFCVPALSGFTPETFLYTPTVDEDTARLRFVSGGSPGASIYGPFLDSVSVTEVPAPRGVLLFLTALAALRGVRRWC